MIRAEAEEIAAKLDESIYHLIGCKSSLGAIPTEDNAEWMKDIILSRIHDVDVLLDEIRWIYGRDRMESDEEILQLIREGYDTPSMLACHKLGIPHNQAKIQLSSELYAMYGKTVRNYNRRLNTMKKYKMVTNYAESKKIKWAVVE